jgi:ribosome maturation protein SDO1
MSFGHKPISMDQEKVHFNVARMKKGGKVFEVVIDPDKALAHKRGEKVELREAIKSEKIFTDAHKGEFSLDSDLKALFGTTDPLKVAEVILTQGEIQLTKEHRDKMREDKKKRVLALIQRNAMDPKTKLPHPLARIENAFEISKCKIDEFQTAEEQVDRVVKAMMSILPIKIEEIVMQIEIPPQFAHQCFGIVKKLGDVKKEVWGDKGELVAQIQIPAGMQEDILNKLNSMTKGTVEIRIIEEKEKQIRK